MILARLLFGSGSPFALEKPMQTRLFASSAALAGLFVAPLIAQDATKTTPPKAERPFALMVGDAAPPLAVEQWIKGEGVNAFAADQVYVVEFWATWCSPCIRGMPHLSDLAEQYAEKGVTVLGIQIWDEAKNAAPFLQRKLAMHDNQTGDAVMRYTVGIEKKDDPNDARNGVMAKTWMVPAGQTGIPAAFIVDQAGKVAWIGHPMGMDGPLAKIVAKEWNLANEAKNYAESIAGQAKLERYNALFAGKKFDQAYALGKELVTGAFKNDSAVLNDLSWRIVDPEAKPAKQDLDLALAAATRANELTENKDAAILDTLATVHHARGDLAKALEFQRVAAKHAKGGQFDAEISSRLKQYEAEAAKGGGK